MRKHLIVVLVFSSMLLSADSALAKKRRSSPLVDRPSPVAPLITPLAKHTMERIVVKGAMPSERDQQMFDVQPGKDVDVRPGETFVLEADRLADKYRGAVANLRLRLVAVEKDGIIVDQVSDRRSEETWLGQEWDLRSSSSSHHLRHGDSIVAKVTVMDLAARFYFSLAVENGVLELTYLLADRCTMPGKR